MLGYIPADGIIFPGVHDYVDTLAGRIDCPIEHGQGILAFAVETHGSRLQIRLERHRVESGRPLRKGRRRTAQSHGESLAEQSSPDGSEQTGMISESDPTRAQRMMNDLTCVSHSSCRARISDRLEVEVVGLHPPTTLAMSGIQLRAASRRTKGNAIEPVPLPTAGVNHRHEANPSR